VIGQILKILDLKIK